MENEKSLNEKILEITMQIKEQYLELSKWVEELQVTIPDEKKSGREESGLNEAPGNVKNAM
ncbi:MAG TPA: hypothetical protein VI731_12225 [Bacteroidia bacterium]|nr:hypothetical protein [Bacteroidia bacterium]